MLGAAGGPSALFVLRGGGPLLTLSVVEKPKGLLAKSLFAGSLLDEPFTYVDETDEEV